MGLSYRVEQKFDDCRDILPLPFDFYIPELNMVIEADGEQHFRPTRFGNQTDEEARVAFEILKKHDAMKNEYCASSGIYLLRIPYWKRKTANVIIANAVASILDNKEKTA